MRRSWSGASIGLRIDDFAREILFDEVDPPLVLAPGPGTPSRTRAKYRAVRIAYQTPAALPLAPLLRTEIDRLAVAIRAVDPREGRRLIDLARAAMVTRQRDLDAFAYGDPRDVRLVECGEGLQFACIGTMPERRLMLEAVYGYLTLKNGVPIGYVLVERAVRLRRGRLQRVRDLSRRRGRRGLRPRAGHDAPRCSTPTRSRFRPYQLGKGNDEALDSGAWWFYRKFGFLPREAVTAPADAPRGTTRSRRDPSHRSSKATLALLGGGPVLLPPRHARDRT